MKYLIGLIALVLPTYLIRFSIGGIPTTVLEVLVYVIFLYGLANMGYCQWSRAKCRVVLPIGILLLTLLISVYISPEKSVALGQFKAFFIDPLLVFWLMLSYLKEEDFPVVFHGLMGSSLFVSIFAIVQKISGNITADNRVIGIFGYSPNYLALFLAPITVLVFAYGWQLFAKKRNWMIGTGGLIVVINLIAMVFSGSRAGLLALFGGLFIFFIVKYWPKFEKRKQLKIGLVLVVILSLTLAWFNFRPNFALSGSSGGREVTSNNVRWQIWQTSFELGEKHPILGVGLGNFQNAFSELTKNRVNFPEFITPQALTPHNIFLMFWLTTGIFGLLSFLWLLIIFFRQGFQYRRNFIAPILFGAMSTILIQGLVDTPYFKNDLSVLFWIIFGLLILLDKKETEEV